MARGFLGYVLAMTLIAMLVPLNHPSQYPSSGYPPAPAIQRNMPPNLNPNCVLMPLPVVATVMLLAILS